MVEKAKGTYNEMQGVALNTKYASREESLQRDWRGSDKFREIDRSKK